ncbi:metallophosphoesterase [Streptomyces sp. DR7-3]|uniref:metallophosphoesterase n=1 Tax=Streptomyces malaysiensis TaxID=92644 RepID=UPI002043406F|nr:metallophosphoesterase [Streptomyces sp. DR7-3]MCM3812450.1 metallophosphoesterase [Streptomyces sp. DR7-3]
MVVLFVLIALAAIGLLTGVHWYVWRRLVRDTTARGGWARRTGTAAAFALPLSSVGALVAGRAGAPFPLQRALAWPGYLWLALLLYLTLALLAGEAVRPLLGAWLGRHEKSADVRSTRGPAAAAETAAAGPTAGASGAPATASAPVGAVARNPDGAATAPAGAPGGLSAALADNSAPAAAATSNGAGTAVASGSVKAGDATGEAATATADGVVTATAGGTGAVVADGGANAVANGAVKGVEGPAEGATGEAGVGGAAGSEGAGSAPSRRLFVARAVAVGATAVAAGTVGYGTYTVLRGPRVKRITVPLAKLPRGAHGFRIAVVSDIHLGPILGRAHTRRVVETVNRTNPDLVAVVGDLVDGSVADLGPAAEPLRALSARHGSYFVTGNHEYYSGADEWVDRVRELGLRPLENERTELPGFDLAGVNDVAGESEGHGPDFGKALGDRDRSRASVLLAHQPVVIHDAVKAGVDLQLSGHTHGGQLWPGTYVAELANPTAAGLERYGDTQLYVTRGAGAWGPPVRVGAPPDVTVVELASTRA